MHAFMCTSINIYQYVYLCVRVCARCVCVCVCVCVHRGLSPYTVRLPRALWPAMVRCDRSQSASLCALALFTMHTLTPTLPRTL